MGTIVDSNKALQLMIDYLRGTLLNTANTYLRLFKNNFTPDPSNILSDFTEADFTGYAAVQVNSKFGSPYKVIDGEYQTDSASKLFLCVLWRFVADVVRLVLDVVRRLDDVGSQERQIWYALRDGFRWFVHRDGLAANVGVDFTLIGEG